MPVHHVHAAPAEAERAGISWDWSSDGCEQTWKKAALVLCKRNVLSLWAVTPAHGFPFL